jgi:hypothetical protein
MIPARLAGGTACPHYPSSRSNKQYGNGGDLTDVATRSRLSAIRSGCGDIFERESPKGRLFLCVCGGAACPHDPFIEIQQAITARVT